MCEPWAFSCPDLFSLPHQTPWMCTQSQASLWVSAWASSASWPACVLACAAAPTGGRRSQSNCREISRRATERRELGRWP